MTRSQVALLAIVAVVVASSIAVGFSDSQEPLFRVGECYRFQLSATILVDTRLSLPPPNGYYQLTVKEVRSDGWLLAEDTGRRLGRGEVWLNTSVIEVFKEGC